MSAPGRPKREFRSAQHEGTPVNTPTLDLRAATTMKCRTP